ncbi:MAG: nucleotidyltransferase domain-containing protein, partial [Ignavibacteria bacterium]|nr:nucleotidyltransferase domain-containing protein [Ignavibacteria bacterium]
MYTQENVNKIIDNFIDAIKGELSVEQVYLFGSYAKGTPGKYSDIDLAIVSKDFEGVRFFDRKRLLKYLVKTNTDVELHPFKSEDFT